jgi:hypothetical protein
LLAQRFDAIANENDHEKAIVRLKTQETFAANLLERCELMKWTPVFGPRV